ncbi:MAG: CHAT domain-containing protein [Bacteroidota bacterium]
MAYKHIGDTHMLRGDPIQAKSYYLKALNFHSPRYKQDFSSTTNQDRLTTTFLALSDYYLSFGEDSLKEGGVYLQKAATLHGIRKNELLERIYRIRADYAQLQGQSDSALYYLELLENFRLDTYGGQSYKVVKVKRKKANILQSQSQLEDALTQLDASIQILTLGQATQEPSKAPFFIPQTLEDRRELLFALTAKAQYLYQQNPKELEMTWYTADWAIHLLDSLKWSYHLGDDKLNLIQAGYETYEIALKILCRNWQRQLIPIPDQGNKIYEIFEKSKSLLLMESMLQDEAATLEMIPAELLEREKVLNLSIYEMQQQLASVKFSQPEMKENKQALQAQLYTVQNAHNSLLDSISSFSAKYSFLRQQDAARGKLSSLQRTLGKGQLAIEYFWGQEMILGLGITSNKIDLFSISLKDSLDFHIGRLKNNLTSPPLHTQVGQEQGFAQFTTSAYYIYKELLSSPIEKFNPESILIVPDGPLTYIPFEILLSSLPDGSTINYNRLEYLLKRYPISYAYALEAWIRQSKLQIDNSKVRSLDFAGFAPYYPKKFSPGTWASRNTLSPTVKWEELPELDNARKELLEIYRLFDSASSALLIDSIATEENYKQIAPQARIVHLAMHSFINDLHPMYSGMMFYHPAQQVGLDGAIYTYEIMNMDIQAELVVLSMCESEAGVYRRGQGLMSLSKAFSMAKCPSLVSSLWAVNDFSTSQIMKLFYEALTKGVSKDVALQQAKLRYLGLGQNTLSKYHPYYWAPFIHIGRQDPITTYKPIDYQTYLMVGFAFAILLLALFIFLRRNRKDSSQ